LGKEKVKFFKIKNEDLKNEENKHVPVGIGNEEM